MKKLIQLLKAEVKTASENPTFIHYEWFLTYHLTIVEKIALETCTSYPKADKNMVLVLVWLHDYGKIMNFDNQYTTTVTTGKKKLLEIGFPPNFVKKVITYMEIFDKKDALETAPIEVQIVSSADGASHLIGPFFTIIWKEFHEWSIEDLLTENKRKASVDWKKKIVIPEIKKAFSLRHKLFLEHCGKFPNKYLS
jgi:hypothetical protein